MIEGLDLNQIFKFLGTSANKTNYDYRRYGEPLLEILIAGSFLAPDSSIAQDIDKVVSTECCLFSNATNLVKVKACDQVFIKLMRQYKYLEKEPTDDMKKIFVHLMGFSEEHCLGLAQLTAL